MSTLLAVDAGQGGTRASLRSADGAVLSEGQADGVRHLWADNGPASTAAVVTKAIRVAVADHPRPRTTVVAVSGWTDDRGRVDEVLARIAAALPDTDLWLTSDAVAAFFALPPMGARVSLVVGTGSVAAAADGSGTWALVDGVGHLLGDDGSGFWIGQRGLASALAAADGRGGSGVLLQLAIRRFGVARGIPERIYGDANPPSSVASFAEDVVGAAEHGEPAAVGIVRDAASLLARAADAAGARVFGDSSVTLLLTGGLMARPGPLMAALEQAISERRQGTRVLGTDQRPVDGAAFLARDPSLIAAWYPGLYGHGGV